MNELQAYQDLVKSCFKLESNLNDTFYWGTSDTGDIDASDIPKIIHIYQQCGSDTLVAYEAIVRGHDPDASMISHWKDKGADFYRAKAMLQPLADAGKIMFERWYNLQEKKIERSLFNGQEIIWKDGKATLPDGTWGEGASISDGRDQLVRKYNAAHNIPTRRCEFPDGDTTKFCPRCHRLGRWTTGGRTGAELDCVWPSVQEPKFLDENNAPPVRPEIVMIREGGAYKSWSEEWNNIKTFVIRWFGSTWNPWND